MLLDFWDTNKEYFVWCLNLFSVFYVVTGSKGLLYKEQNMISDEELLCELQKGRESALEALVHRYHRQIFAYLYRMTHNYHPVCIFRY